MADRSSIILLCTSLAILLFVAFVLKSKGKSFETKVTRGTYEESRSQDVMEKYVESIRNIEARLQTLEDSSKQKQNEKQETIEDQVEVADFQLGAIKRGDSCFDSAEHGEGGELEVMECHKKGRNQEWQYRDLTFQAAESGFCMKNEKGKGPVTLEKCNSKETSQQWHIEDS